MLLTVVLATEPRSTLPQTRIGMESRDSGWPFPGTPSDLVDSVRSTREKGGVRERDREREVRTKEGRERCGVKQGNANGLSGD